jgi:hypothetical protein
LRNQRYDNDIARL